MCHWLVPYSKKKNIDILGKNEIGELPLPVLFKLYKIGTNSIKNLGQAFSIPKDNRRTAFLGKGYRALERI